MLNNSYADGLTGVGALHHRPPSSVGKDQDMHSYSMVIYPIACYFVLEFIFTVEMLETKPNTTRLSSEISLVHLPLPQSLHARRLGF
jgi:hypothetical protein